MSDDEKKNSKNIKEGDPEEAKILSELLKKKETKPAQEENKGIFAKKLFGAHFPQPKPPAPKPVAPSPPKHSASPQPPKNAPIPPRYPQSSEPSVPKPAISPTPKPRPKSPLAQTKPSQPPPPPRPKPVDSLAPSKPVTPPLPPSSPSMQIEEEENVKVVTAEDFDKIGHPTTSPPAENHLKVQGTGTKDLTREEFEEEEDFPELVTRPGAPETVVPVLTETVSPLPTGNKEPATGLETRTVLELESWELESPVDESASLEELSKTIIAPPPRAEDIPLKPESEPVVFKAAKDKEGPSAIEETKELIEKLDGLDEGFLDVGEVKRGLKLLEELVLKVKELEERISALEKPKN